MIKAARPSTYGGELCSGSPRLPGGPVPPSFRHPGFCKGASLRTRPRVEFFSSILYPDEKGGDIDDITRYRYRAAFIGARSWTGYLPVSPELAT